MGRQVTDTMRVQVIFGIIVALAIGAFVWLAVDYDFLQDDAFITFRYVENYLDGQGLVFNEGERIEGYTNFGWLLYLLFTSMLGLPLAEVARITGILLGAATILAAYLLARRILPERAAWAALPATVLLAGNLSFAYWSQAGLETAAFACLTALGLHLYLKRSYVLILVLALAVLVRPEGALLAGILLILELVESRRWPRFTVTCALTALILSLPYVGFKLAYFGSILPNPFYAKTGFDLEQVTGGLEYAGRFFGHYPVSAAVLVLIPILWRHLNRSVRVIWLFTIIYVFYIVLIGGDVLKVHRFFLPVMASLAVMTSWLVVRAVTRLKPIGQYLGVTVVTAALVAVAVIVPRDFIAEYEYREKLLVDKMAFLADRITDIDSTDFSVATATIGSFAYHLPGHRVIDLVGLTDSVIARHPESIPEGMATTWRERNFNSAYVLQEAPDYIVFSTGYKPSAPAERSLMTYRQFLDGYGGLSFYYQPPGVELSHPLVSIFRKKLEPHPPFEPAVGIGFVQAYNMAINANSAGRFEEADRYFRQALELGGEPPYVYLLMRMALNDFALGKVERGEVLRNRILELDSTVAEVQADLFLYEYTVGNHEKAAIHRSWMRRLSPWMVRRYDSLAQVRARWWQNRSNQAD